MKKQAYRREKNVKTKSVSRELNVMSKIETS